MVAKEVIENTKNEIVERIRIRSKHNPQSPKMHLSNLNK